MAFTMSESWMLRAGLSASANFKRMCFITLPSEVISSSPTRELKCSRSAGGARSIRLKNSLATADDEDEDDDEDERRALRAQRASLSIGGL